MASITSSTSSSTINGDHLEAYKDLFYHIKSADEEERKRAIVRIPNLILDYIELKNELAKQILLVIYNLNTNGELYENLTLSNRPTVIRLLLRLYLETLQNDQHQHDQVDALVRLVNHSNTSELLIELTNVLYHCFQCKQMAKEDSRKVQEAMNTIREKAAANMQPEALLMIHSIIARMRASC